MTDKVNFKTARQGALSANSKPSRNKKNEKLEKVLQEAVMASAVANGKDNWQEDSELARQWGQLHASWLCYKEGSECMQKLCLFLTAVSGSLATNWQAFAGALGLTNNQIMYISNKQACATTDSTELVIRTYSQNKNANLLQVIKALDTIKRYDALQQLKGPLKQLANEVKLLVESDEANFIDGKSSSEDSSEHLIAPKNYQKEIRRLLPTALQNLVPNRNTETVQQTKNDDNNNVNRQIVQQEVLVGRQSGPTVHSIPQTPALALRPKQNINVFLTFAADGELAARRIARSMRTTVKDRQAFGVLILDENAEKILNNPEILINRLFYQVHFIMPILTVGYMKAINSPLIDTDMDAQMGMRSALDSLDASYVKFIHNLMINEYTENNCRNERFRCIIPKVDMHTQKKLFATMKKPGYLNPTLRAWTYEKDLETFLRRLIGLYQ